MIPQDPSSPPSQSAAFPNKVTMHCPNNPSPNLLTCHTMFGLGNRVMLSLWIFNEWCWFCWSGNRTLRLKYGVSGGRWAYIHSQIIIFWFSQSVQSLSRVRLCDPMNRSTPGLPVHYQLLASTQTHVHGVGEAIQPSHHLSSPSPPALNLSQHQGLFKWVGWLKILELKGNSEIFLFNFPNIM